MLACVHAGMRACVHACVRALLCVGMLACVHACMPACVHACTRVCVHTPTRPLKLKKKLLEMINAFKGKRNASKKLNLMFVEAFHWFLEAFHYFLKAFHHLSKCVLLFELVEHVLHCASAEKYIGKQAP